MTSAIDATKPVQGTPTTASVRANMLTAKNEISALQASLALAVVGIASSVTGQAMVFADATGKQVAAGPILSRGRLFFLRS